MIMTMNPLIIVLFAVLATAGLIISNAIFPSDLNKKATRAIIVAPLVVGALLYGGNLIAAQFVYRDALAATRTVHAEWKLASKITPASGYPDFGDDYASLVKHGQLGTTTTSNGYDVTMVRGPENTYTATVTKDGKPYAESTTDDLIRFNQDQKWVAPYPFWFQFGI
jgi:hypothetical protein